MPTIFNIHTGSSADATLSASVTSSDAITADMISSMGIRSSFSSVQGSIAYMNEERGTKGSSHNDKVQKYLHQRQENIIKYAHKKDGYGYIYIKPSDIKIWGPLSVSNTSWHAPQGVFLSSATLAFATFKVPKGAVIFTDEKPENSIFVHQSASALHLDRVAYEIHMYPVTPSETYLDANQTLKGIDATGLRLKEKYNYNVNNKIIYPHPLGLLGGNDATYHVLTLPAGKPAYQSQRLFYGARIPIKMS